MINCKHYYEDKDKDKKCIFSLKGNDKCNVCNNMYSSNYMKAYEGHCNTIKERFYSLLSRSKDNLIPLYK